MTHHSAPNKGYYRFPTLYNDTLIFTAEGDLWRVDVGGGGAQRLTTHHGQETHAAVSPDGALIAFSAQYEGPIEVYTMPLHGGRPVRRSFDDDEALVVGWTPDGKIIYATKRYAGVPNTQLRTIDLETGMQDMIPLHQAADGCYDEAGAFYFTRLPFQGSHTKRYKGGTVQNIWKFAKDAAEAVLLTADYPGTSKTPMWWDGRLYFASDRDGTMNLWSMTADGADLQQHTRHSGWDVQTPALHNGRIVYQLGADLWLYDIPTSEDALLEITLASDFDQTRQRWVQYPLSYLEEWHFSPTGDRLALTVRGRVFVAPTEQGRLVEVTRESGVRYRDARFWPDGDALLAMSDASGELEFYQLPADGMGETTQLTHNGDVFRYQGVPSPDGNWVAITDKNYRLWLLNVESGAMQQIVESEESPLYDPTWSPDSQWLAFVESAANGHVQIKLYSMAVGTITAVTSDRIDSYSPTWSPDGDWLYFLSDRHFKSLVPSPWGARQPDPYFEDTTKLYALALRSGLRFPFRPDDELFSAANGNVEKKNNNNGKSGEKGETAVTVAIEFEQLPRRLYELPVPPGSYSRLAVNKKALFWVERAVSENPKFHLIGMEIKNKDVSPETLAHDIKGYVLSADGKKLAVQQKNAFYTFDATGKAPKREDKKRVDLSNWSFAVDRLQEWRQMFVEAWRLERDYFYDPNLHGIDWQGLLDRHLPLVERITDREELDNLLAQLVGELSALHTYVRGGDKRRGRDQIRLASLGATWQRDETGGGYRVDHIYRADPDYPTTWSPLMHPDVPVTEGDVITAINGVPTLSVAHPALLLQNQAGQQVRLTVQPDGAVAPVETVITPVTPATDAELRYAEWEYLNRQRVEEMGQGAIGYLHLRAMGGDNFSEWVRGYYPVFDRSGLIIDVRYNRGGNIDSWILGKLLRRAWFYWQQRVGRSYWNMQYAFRGHMVVLCNEFTASDGEAFADGFRRLELGQVIGTRTWGGEIWLSYNTGLVDKGIASAAQMGVYTPEGEWLIEGHGVEPDIVVDNLPHATFAGADAQLETAVDHLQARIAAEPVTTPLPPPFPDKSFRYE